MHPMRDFVSGPDGTNFFMHALYHSRGALHLGLFIPVVAEASFIGNVSLVCKEERLVEKLDSHTVLLWRVSSKLILSFTGCWNFHLTMQERYTCSIDYKMHHLWQLFPSSL